VDDKVDPYVLHALKAFHELGCEIVFCTGTLADSEFEKLLPLVRYVVVRNRFGYDFTSWVAGVTAQVPVGDFERVIFTNDSFFFPVGSPGAMFDAMAASEAGLWGLTDSYQGWERPRFHLQSYFLAMRGSELIERLVDKYRLIGVLCRRGVIEEFELWFSAEAEREGMAVEGMVKADELVKSARMAPLYLNPTVHCWRELLVSKKCPILKVAVVRDNPVRNFSLKDFEGLKLDYPVGLIEGYLARVKGKARGEFRRG
jgi:lipopolysaccharide biosynthesis protein